MRKTAEVGRVIRAAGGKWRFDKTDRHFLASHSLAAILDWLNDRV